MGHHGKYFTLPDEEFFVMNDTDGLKMNITIGRIIVDLSKRNHTVMAASVMFGVGVFGNLLALFVLARSSPEQRRTLFYRLVAGLAVSDLLGTVAVSPVVISVYVNNFVWVGGVALCEYFSCMMIVAGLTTMFIVTSMAVERYICVRHPYLYYTKLTTTYATSTILGSWIISVLIGVFPLLGVGTNVFQFPGTWCFFNYTSDRPMDVIFSYIYATISLITIFITAFCNVAVIYTLVCARKRSRLLNSADGSTRKFTSNNQRYAEIQMVVLLIGITIVFTTCYFPLMLYVLLCQTDLVSMMNTKHIGLLMIRFASFNPILDPWVYILLRREIVWKITGLVKCVLRVESKPSTEARDVSRVEDSNCCLFCLQCVFENPAGRFLTTPRPSVTTLQTAPYSNGRRDSGGRCNNDVTKAPNPAEELLLQTYVKGTTTVQVL